MVMSLYKINASAFEEPVANPLLAEEHEALSLEQAQLLFDGDSKDQLLLLEDVKQQHHKFEDGGSEFYDYIVNMESTDALYSAESKLTEEEHHLTE